VGERKDLATYYLRYRSGPFHFLVPPGSYHLVAYEDRNGSMQYEDGEPGYYVGDREPPLALAPGATRDLGSVTLTVAKRDVAELKEAAARDLKASLELSRFHRGSLLKWEDPRFTIEAGREGMWTPLQAFTTHGAGLFMLEPYDARRIPVVFVHGMAGTARNFRAISEKLDRRFQAWFFQYPSGIRLELAAEFLETMIVEMHARHRFERYAVVAHSAGGLVSRAAIARLGQQGGPVPSAFVTISTPWNGQPAAEMGTRRSPVVLPAWIDLVPDSPFLRKLFAAPLGKRTPSYVFFGFTGGNGTDGTVTLASMLRPAAQEEAVRVIGFPEDHISILADGALFNALERVLATELPAR
jgi:pimeloyl-ACP methyl ester carboxylesterase